MLNYNRDYAREKEQNKILSNPDFLFGLTHKDCFNIKLENQRSRLTGDRSNSLAKNKNTIIHSNSTSHIRQEIMPSFEKKYNIININVNNLIINNNNLNNIKNSNYSKDKNNLNNMNHNKVFSKAGNAIMGKSNNNLNANKKSKFQNNHYLNNIISNSSNNRSSSQKPIQNAKNNIGNNSPSSDIQDVINDLIETTKSPPPNLKKIDKCINDETININVINNNNLVSQLISDEKIIELHTKLWEGFLNIEMNVDNKNGINNQLKKVLNLIEKEFTEKNKVNENIFKIIQLNKVYTKIIKIYFTLITYFKFLLVDFNYETTIKSNIKRLLSSISNQLLLLLATHTSNDNNLFQKLNKDFMDIYPKIVRVKKIRKSKDNLNLFCTNMNKNLELSIYVIKQFSNNFFKIGFFRPIHDILFEIFLSIDTYSILDIGNIIINGVLFYLLHNTHPEKKATTAIPSVISLGGLQNSLAALGFFDVPAPYLPQLPENIEKTTYTLVLDLDETLVHFFFTPSGGNFLIRPYCFKFLEDMSKIFEVAIFTAATKDYADSILDIIDPNKKLINHRLYRHHTSIREMCFVKDLTKIGRNLNRCLIIDNIADNFKFQPDNGIQCTTWIDNMRDTQLNDLDLILTKIIEKKPQDIRPIIKKLNEEVNKKMKNNMNLNPFKDIDVSKLFK